MKLVAFLLLSTLAFAAPLDKVKTYAHGHKVTIRRWHGNVWVEAEGLDPFGVGKTVDEAAKDFLKSADIMDHEKNQPVLKYAKPEETPCPADSDVSTACQNSPL